MVIHSFNHDDNRNIIDNVNNTATNINTTSISDNVGNNSLDGKNRDGNTNINVNIQDHFKIKGTQNCDKISNHSTDLTLNIENHRNFLSKWYDALLSTSKITPDSTCQSLELLTTQHIKINAIYWGYMSKYLLGDDFHSNEIFSIVKSCYNPSVGAFFPDTGCAPNIVATLSAIQIYHMEDAMALLAEEKNTIFDYINSLFNPDGSVSEFKPNTWSCSPFSTDTKYIYCALLSVFLLDESLHKNTLQVTLNYLCACQNIDGGFGCVINGESHAAHTFCSVGSLMLIGHLAKAHSDLFSDSDPARFDGVYVWNHINVQNLLRWLSGLQTSQGGLAGRPSKLEDVCYSWWILATLQMLDKKPADLGIDPHALINFILRSQAPIGGFSDRPGNIPDVFHTFFALAGLSLLDPSFVPHNILSSKNLPLSLLSTRNLPS